MADTLRDSRLVTLAAVVAAHGITGEVRLKLFGEGVVALKRYRAFCVSGDAGRVLNVKSLKDDGKGGAYARFAECIDRTAAEKLRGSTLDVPRSQMPELAEGEYYHADLLGLPAVSTEGVVLGVVIAVENFGAGDVLEIERLVEGKKQRFMVPMRAEAVPDWDSERVVIEAAFAEG
jgi:16S rRNA processing protein RimM